VSTGTARELADRVAGQAESAGQKNVIRTLYRTHEMSGGRKIPTK